MKIPPTLAASVSFSLLAAQMLLSSPALAATKTYASNQNVVVNGHALTIVAGSVGDVSVSADALTVSIPEGESFDVRTDEDLAVLENDGLLPTCHVLRDRTNRLFANGPRTLTVLPVAQSNCSSAGSSNDDTTTLVFSVPAVGESVVAGREKQIFWSTEGRSPASVRIRLSVDGGKSYPVTIAENEFNGGFYAWNVPDMPSASQARIKLEAWNSGAVTAFSLSPVFSIVGTSPEVVPPAEENGEGMTVTPYDYETAEETASAATIGVDKGIVGASVGSVLSCAPDTRIKTAGNSAVYYCGADGKRYVFPNLKTYQSWYGDDFNGIVELTAADLQRIPLGGNVTYRPGVRMLKIQSAPEVFAVAADGTLRHVTEQAAIRLYGIHWNQMIDDLPDAFFADYVVGEPVRE